MKLLITTLCACLIAGPVKAQEQTKAGPVAAGVVVVVVGGVVVVILVKTCKKLFPKTTNAPPELALTGGSCAAGSFWFDGYCQENDVKFISSSERLVSGIVDEHGNITQFSLLGEKETETENEFRAYLSSIGIPLDYGTHYSRDGIPCTEADVPVSVSHGDVPSVRVGCDGLPAVTRVVERSYDLVTWTPVVTNTVSACYSVRFTDRSEGEEAYYRTRPY